MPDAGSIHFDFAKPGVIPRAQIGYLPATVANRVIFMDKGEIVEQNEPSAFFTNPQNERTKLFLSQIIH